MGLTFSLRAAMPPPTSADYRAQQRINELDLGKRDNRGNEEDFDARYRRFGKSRVWPGFHPASLAVLLKEFKMILIRFLENTLSSLDRSWENAGSYGPPSVWRAWAGALAR